jgi:UDP-N-acetyl-D-mannosaminuronic acid dehydrogenase
LFGRVWCLDRLIEELIGQIHSRRISLAVLGIGYVGLPTASLFADVGFNVVAVDIRPEQVKLVNNGVSPIDEPGLNQLISRNVKAGRLKASLDSDYSYDADGFIITVQTPILADLTPDLSFLQKSLEKIKVNLKKGSVIAVCSTVPPGTMKSLKNKFEYWSGLKADVDFFLAYVPERIAPGKALTEFVENTRLVGGIGQNSTKVASELFRTVCRDIVQTEAATAEIAKLAENAFRDVNIAFANQLALICEQHEADVKKVVQLANTHPRVNIHSSGPGVGGPCLTKDPYLLVYGSQCADEDVIKNARCLNNSMAQHVVKLVSDALVRLGKNVKAGRIACLGTAYKADVDDTRFSPSEPIIQGLLKLGADVIVYDPFCSSSFGAKKSLSLLETVENADCLVILTDHSVFKELAFKDIGALMRKPPVIVDCRRIVDPDYVKKIGFVYYGVGYGSLGETNGCT